MWLAGCFLVGGCQVDWALNAILGHKHNEPVCPDLHANRWATSGVRFELPAAQSSANFTTQEPQLCTVWVRHSCADWLAESQHCPQEAICGAPVKVVRPAHMTVQLHRRPLIRLLPHPGAQRGSAAHAPSICLTQATLRCSGST